MKPFQVYLGDFAESRTLGTGTLIGRSDRRAGITTTYCLFGDFGDASLVGPTQRGRRHRWLLLFGDHFLGD